MTWQYRESWKDVEVIEVTVPFDEDDSMGRR